MQYPQLQGSPEMFQNPQIGPMTEPAIPNARFSWDISSQPPSFQSGGVMDVQQNLFGTVNPISPPVPSWPSNDPSPVVDPNTTIPVERQAQDFWLTDTVNPQHTMSFSSDPLFSSPTAVVNPSMLFGFSSPQQAPEVSPSHLQVQQLDMDTMGRQPYEHQTRESNWEKELAKKSKQQNRTATVPSSFSASTRHALHRSNTDSGFRKVQNRSVESRSITQALENAARKNSPLKRLSQASLTSIPEAIRPRPRPRLVVDESGRARTETDPIDVDPANEPKSLWDDDDDSDSDELVVPSQRNSFAYPSDHVRSAKHARNDSGDQSFNASKRPLSSASLASITSRLEATPLGKKSARNSMDSNYHRFSMGSFVGSQTGEGSNDGEALNEETSSDAQSALKSMVEQRAKKKGIIPPVGRRLCFVDLTRVQNKTILKQPSVPIIKDGHKQASTFQNSAANKSWRPLRPKPVLKVNPSNFPALAPTLHPTILPRRTRKHRKSSLRVPIEASDQPIPPAAFAQTTAPKQTPQQ
jgi:hypothetical protein